MATTYLQAITPSDLDSVHFDPKDKQKAVYKWYDLRYSDEALDIYSKEWQNRILIWHEAHQRAIKDINQSLTSEELLETLHFGNFFLAHPIAAFSLWRVLQACYELDRAVCGNTEEVASWQSLPPFKYLRDSSIQLRWRTELENLKQQIKSNRSTSAKETWELKLYGIWLAVEDVEREIVALKENFTDNLVDMKFASWMKERIDEDVFGLRFTMITGNLKLKDNELASVQQTESHDEENMVETGLVPKLTRAPTFPPAYPSQVETKANQKHDANLESRKPALGPAAADKRPRTGGVMSSLKGHIRRIKHKVRRPYSINTH